MENSLRERKFPLKKGAVNEWDADLISRLIRASSKSKKPELPIYVIDKKAIIK
jgi:hypothetical protein